jgi:hypothetical protein
MAKKLLILNIFFKNSDKFRRRTSLHMQFIIKLMLTLPLLIAFIILQNTAKATDLSKTVCTITINSSEEQETFKKYLKPQGFKFVELIPSNDEVDSKVNWFAKACKRVKENGIHCDALVVSGHFGGIFFDSNRINPSLSLEDMEAQSCSSSYEVVVS